jgi:hypothetical protein
MIILHRFGRGVREALTMAATAETQWLEGRNGTRLPRASRRWPRLSRDPLPNAPSGVRFLNCRSGLDLASTMLEGFSQG